MSNLENVVSRIAMLLSTDMEEHKEMEFRRLLRVLLLEFAAEIKRGAIEP